jgi:hypothetical protein
MDIFNGWLPVRITSNVESESGSDGGRTGLIRLVESGHRPLLHTYDDE